MSPLSSSMRPCEARPDWFVACPQTPAKQSACSSSLTDSSLRCDGLRACHLAHPRVDAGQRLHVMSDLVREDVCLGEIPRGAEALLQLVEEAQIEVDVWSPGQ